ncbi:MAG: hypothetical protein RML93_11190 [Anaerolineales bacterium]|nr:hypothetical protein [Anaerolineales bacterium]MCS7249002.1 hypothetical protein [Anaerolineales bacterium]MDW8162815.1 hypothetical protein [Anaerolineales bacterium]MDW8447841.1 hypothetical protein [Anaerolineales bacterium]
MSGNPNREIQRTPNSGFFWELSARIKLVLRLLADRRVHPLLKLLPIASLAYLLIPDLAPGPVDDALLIWLSTTLFVELCPPEVVEEHLKKIRSSVTSQLHEEQSRREFRPEDIEDAEFWEEPKQ